MKAIYRASLLRLQSTSVEMCGNSDVTISFEVEDSSSDSYDVGQQDRYDADDHVTTMMLKKLVHHQ